MNFLEPARPKGENTTPRARVLHRNDSSRPEDGRDDLSEALPNDSRARLGPDTGKLREGLDEGHGDSDRNFSEGSDCTEQSGCRATVGGALSYTLASRGDNHDMTERTTSSLDARHFRYQDRSSQSVQPSAIPDYSGNPPPSEHNDRSQDSLSPQVMRRALLETGVFDDFENSSSSLPRYTIPHYMPHAHSYHINQQATVTLGALGDSPKPQCEGKNTMVTPSKLDPRIGNVGRGIARHGSGVENLPNMSTPAKNGDAGPLQRQNIGGNLEAIDNILSLQSQASGVHPEATNPSKVDQTAQPTTVAGERMPVYSHQACQTEAPWSEVRNARMAHTGTQTTRTTGPRSTPVSPINKTASPADTDPGGDMLEGDSKPVAKKLPDPHLGDDRQSRQHHVQSFPQEMCGHQNGCSHCLEVRYAPSFCVHRPRPTLVRVPPQHAQKRLVQQESRQSYLATRGGVVGWPRGSDSTAVSTKPECLDTKGAVHYEELGACGPECGCSRNAFSQNDDAAAACHPERPDGHYPTSMSYPASYDQVILTEENRPILKQIPACRTRGTEAHQYVYNDGSPFDGRGCSHHGYQSYPGVPDGLLVKEGSSHLAHAPGNEFYYDHVDAERIPTSSYTLGEAGRGELEMEEANGEYWHNTVSRPCETYDPYPYFDSRYE